MQSYTSYSKVNEILEYIVKHLERILGNQIIGVYLDGSLALGDFIPERSDIDIVVVARNALHNEQLEKITSMYQTLSQSNLTFAKRMECIYVPQESLSNYVAKRAFFPCLHVGGEFYTD